MKRHTAPRLMLAGLYAFFATPALSQPNGNIDPTTGPVASDRGPDPAPTPPTEADPSAVPAIAELPPELNSDAIDTYLADLDADDWSTRQRATESLMLDATLTDEQLGAALRNSSLSPEARLRLARALRHRILDAFVRAFPQPPFVPDEPGRAGPAEPDADEAQRAALRAQIEIVLDGERAGAASLGISHSGQVLDPVPGRDGAEVLVVDTLPGFPAYPKLRPGDAIIRFNGEPLPPPLGGNEPPPINQVIQRFDAQDAVQITVVRVGSAAPVTLDVELASLAALRRIYTSRAGVTALADEYADALQRRWKQLVGDDVPLP